jgi:hypothetical protein
VVHGGTGRVQSCDEARLRRWPASDAGEGAAPDAQGTLLVRPVRVTSQGSAGAEMIGCSGVSGQQ